MTLHLLPGDPSVVADITRNTAQAEAARAVADLAAADRVLKVELLTLSRAQLIETIEVLSRRVGGPAPVTSLVREIKASS